MENEDTIERLYFHLSSEKLEFKIDATLNIRKLGVNKFEASAEEMYTAIDKIIHKIDVKINREKSRIQDHSKLGHQDMVDFFTEHEKNQPEPTKNIMLHSKPSTLSDAYQQMIIEGTDFYGFNLIHEKSEEIAPAFLRKLDDKLLYLFKKVKDDAYAEYLIKIQENNLAVEDKKIKDIFLKNLNLFEAQKDVLEQEFHFNIFIDNKNNVNFLFKEGNGKWKLIS